LQVKQKPKTGLLKGGLYIYLITVPPPDNGTATAMKKCGL
jgi:hypothetical protein